MIIDHEQDLTVAAASPVVAVRRHGAHPLGGVSPLHVIAAVASALAVWQSAGPLEDFDSYWHVEVGRQIARLHRVTDLPSWWLDVPGRSGWVTSQWLSELAMYGATSAGGWRALMVVNLMLMVALVSALWFILVRGHVVTIGVPVFLLTLIGTYGGILQRPQAVSLVLLPWLGLACSRLLARHHPPPLAVVAVTSLLWAQFHGLWILGPVAFAIVAAGITIDRAQPWRQALADARPALLCLLASMSGVVNPHGLRSFVLPFEFRAQTAFITEWWPTTFTFSYTLGWGLLLLVVFAAWARTTTPIPRSEVLWVIAWTVFGLQSYRNVAPALLLVAPVAIVAMTRARADRPRRARPPTGRREAQALAGASALIVAGGLVAGIVHLSTVDPLAETQGARIAAWVARQPAPVRIMNSWNVSGALVGLSGGKARLTIDGRADLWGADYAERLQHAESMRPGWQATLTDLHPQAIVTERLDALVSGLQPYGWRVAMTDGDFVLLLPGPGARFT